MNNHKAAIVNEVNGVYKAFDIKGNNVTDSIYEGMRKRAYVTNSVIVYDERVNLDNWFLLPVNKYKLHYRSTNIRTGNENISLRDDNQSEQNGAEIDKIHLNENENPTDKTDTDLNTNDNNHRAAVIEMKGNKFAAFDCNENDITGVIPLSKRKRAYYENKVLVYDESISKRWQLYTSDEYKIYTSPSYNSDLDKQRLVSQVDTTSSDDGDIDIHDYDLHKPETVKDLYTHIAVQVAKNSAGYRAIEIHSGKDISDKVPFEKMLWARLRGKVLVYNEQDFGNDWVLLTASDYKSYRSSNIIPDFETSGNNNIQDFELDEIDEDESINIKTQSTSPIGTGFFDEPDDFL